MWQTIIQTVIPGIILGFITFIASELIWVRYFKTRPKIYIDFKNEFLHAPTFDNRDFDHVRCEYDIIITFSNNSPYDATNLSIIWPFKDNPIDINLSKYNFIKAYDHTTIKTKFTVVVEKAIADSFNHNLSNYRPQEIEKLYFNVEYENEFGRKFITRVFWDNRVEHSEIFNDFPIKYNPFLFYEY